MLSDEATPRTKGKIFGFHRSMDTLGAVLGPSALLYLYFYPENYTLFAFIRFFAISATLLLKEERFKRKSNSLLLVLGYWSKSSHVP
jgi:hypothetical protein